MQAKEAAEYECFLKILAVLSIKKKPFRIDN